MTPLNYKHLHYFWVVAQEGSMTRPPSGLASLCRRSAGNFPCLNATRQSLFNQPGPRPGTQRGRTPALGYADQIFQLGDALVEAIQSSDSESTLRLRAGISDGIPKLLAYRLLSSVTSMPVDVRLICDEGEFETLLADLALHRLDVVLTDRAAPVGGNLKVFSTRLGDFANGLFAIPALVERYRPGFPQSLDGAPMLLPTRHNALRGRIDRWLESTGVRPRSSANSRTARCSIPSGGAGWAFSRHRSPWPTRSPLSSMPRRSAQWLASANRSTPSPTNDASVTRPLKFSAPLRPKAPLSRGYNFQPPTYLKEKSMSLLRQLLPFASACFAAVRHSPSNSRSPDPRRQILAAARNGFRPGVDRRKAR
jgi:LysR family transcriptional activator of nhaA